jgi:hypothetical protein
VLPVAALDDSRQRAGQGVPDDHGPVPGHAWRARVPLKLARGPPGGGETHSRRQEARSLPAGYPLSLASIFALRYSGSRLRCLSAVR